MASCCGPGGYEQVFDHGYARSTAERYRRRGLDRAGARIVREVVRCGVEGATVLEIGGGVGGVQIELLRHGAARTTNVELSSAYEQEAQRLIAAHGLAGRVDRRVVDIASAPGDVEPADIVVMHRVVCCYPDYRLLLTAAAQHARALVVFSHPPRNALSRGVFASENLTFRLRRSPFRVYTHPPSAMREVLETQGLQTTTVPGTFSWRVTTAVRRPHDASDE